MSLRRFNAKRDANEPEIVEALTKAGANSGFIRKTDRFAYGLLTGNYTCQICGKSCRGRVFEGRGKYCSKACHNKAKRTTQRGANNPNFRDAGRHVCVRCGVEFRRHNKASKYCGRSCYASDQRDGLAKRAAQNADYKVMRAYGARKDANHKEILDTLQKLCPVIDLSHCGYGVPDGIAYIDGQYQLFDVKNPNTYYGRSGLNKRQREWVAKFQGGPVYLIYNVDEAEKFARGEFQDLKVVKSGWQEAQEKVNENA